VYLLRQVAAAILFVFARADIGKLGLAFRQFIASTDSDWPVIQRTYDIEVKTMELSMNITSTEKRAGYKEIRKQRLTRQQLGAMRLAAKVGNHIRDDYPAIAEEYRNWTTAPELVTKYRFDQRYGVGREVAISAVRNAIRGYSGHCHESYNGLIDDKSERENLADAHNRQSGIEEYELKRGIHAMTREQKAAAGRKGGLIGGPLSYRLRIGCHAQSPEALREHCRRIAPLGGKAGGAASVVARGLVPYAPATSGRVGEIEFALHLAADPYYLGPVRANFRKMAEKVNEVFHAGNLRYTRTTLKIAFQSHRRRNRSAVESPMEPEMLFTEKLVGDPVYQLPARIKAAAIAGRVNEEYHGGRPVRNPIGISDIISRYKRPNENSTDGAYVYVPWNRTLSVGARSAGSEYSELRCEAMG
jgi:hypothetical protein